MDHVILHCVKEKSKLRVKILSPGYYQDANCMFPRDLRIEGRKFKVPVYAVQLITTRGKYYYSVKDKFGIDILDEGYVIPPPADMKIFEDIDNPECCICLSEPKSVVINPCGHYYMCKGCSASVTKCPICRVQIKGCIEKSQFE